MQNPSKGIIYYSDCLLDPRIAIRACERIDATRLPIVSCTLKPMPGFGKNIYHMGPRSAITMFRQILIALEAHTTDIVFFCEADVLYHESHFNFEPPRPDVWYYNTNVWRVDAKTGHSVRTDDRRQVSGICVYRELAVEHYRKRLARVQVEGFDMRMGYEPGTHRRPQRVDDSTSDRWESEWPNVDIRHDSNLSPSRFRKDQYRNKKYLEGWTEAEEVPGWGRVIIQ